MRITKLITWGITLLALLLGGIGSGVSAQGPDVLEFPETRFTVSGDFLTYYRTVETPMLILGYPISEPFTDAFTGNLVQYFDRARLELHPLAPAAERVTMTNLGELLYTPGSPAADVPNSGPACRFFPQTQFSVCYAFLDYYDANDGTKYFGQPISPTIIKDGRTVQYFERARMEWRGEAPAGQRVGLSNLGRQYLEIIGRPDPQVGNVSKLSSLKVRAFVSESLLNANSEQTLYVIVQDMDLKPVKGATIGLIVTLPDGKQSLYKPESSNADGISIYRFRVGAVNVKEIVRVRVVASYNGMEQRTNTWFRIWW